MKTGAKKVQVTIYNIENSDDPYQHLMADLFREQGHRVEVKTVDKAAFCRFNAQRSSSVALIQYGDKTITVKTPFEAYKFIDKNGLIRC